MNQSCRRSEEQASGSPEAQPIAEKPKILPFKIPVELKGKHNKSANDDPALGNMEKFYHAVPWDEWRMEFFLELNLAGGYRYLGVTNFAQKKAKNGKQLMFLLWYLGPPTDPPQYSFCKPQDWVRQRREVRLNGEQTIKARRQELQNQINAFACLKASADGLVELICMYDQLILQVHEMHAFSLHVDGMSRKQLRERNNEYFDTLKRLAKMRSEAQDDYAKALAVDPKSLPYTMNYVLNVPSSTMNRADKEGHLKTQ